MSATGATGATGGMSGAGGLGATGGMSGTGGRGGAGAMSHTGRVLAPIPFRRLLVVEARKLADTRSGKIMTAVLAALALAAVAGRGFVTDPKLQTLAFSAGMPIATLMPVLAILAVTGEWSHRTALTTFTLEPRRGRVLAAKYVPAMAAALAASLLAALVAVPATAAVAAVRGVPAVWEMNPLALLGWAGTNVLMVAMGLALGTLLLNAPAAIVVYLVNPMLWSVVGRLGDTGETLAGWLDLNATVAPLVTGDMTGGGAARLAVSAALWIVLPMTAGAVRVARKEVG
ncbi:ABC transporter permease [Streptosporangium sandarakinum]